MQTRSIVDNLICEVDNALRTLLPMPNRQGLRPSPGLSEDEADLSIKEKRHIAGLMRINHVGEICAQALYQGQARVAKSPTVKSQMLQASVDEIDHLAWCEERLAELGAHPSAINFFWYGGAYLMGITAGLVSDNFSLGFIAETEHQVALHLQQHMTKLPPHDKKTYAILRQMEADETKHRTTAIIAGADDLPFIIKRTMRFFAKCMCTISYYI